MVVISRMRTRVQVMKKILSLQEKYGANHMYITTFAKSETTYESMEVITIGIRLQHPTTQFMSVFRSS
jgi:hypothetical protein